MKNLFLLLILSLSCAMWSCGGGSSDNTSVKDVVSLIAKGAAQQDSIDNGTLDICDIPEANYFNTPNGNIFANKKILAVIKANPDYKLSNTDKEMLTTAIEKYFAGGKTETSTVYGAYADGLNAAGLSIAKEAIEDAKTLYDLYKIGVAKELVF